LSSGAALLGAGWSGAYRDGELHGYHDWIAAQAAAYA
jgi:hypothetical protein